MAQRCCPTLRKRWTGFVGTTVLPLYLAAAAFAAEQPRTGLPDVQQPPATAASDAETMFRRPTVYLGVFPQTLSEQRAAELGVSPPQGVYLVKVVEGSPADRAGLKRGDVVVSINGQAVVNGEHFRDLLRKQTPGQAMTLGVVRDKQRLTLTVVPEKPRVSVLALPDGPFGITIDPEACREQVEQFREQAERVREMAEQMRRLGEQRRAEIKGGALAMVFSDRGRLGVRTQTLSEQLARYFGVTEGVLVTEVIPGSPAEKAGIRAGDCLVKIGDRPIRDSRDLARELRRAEAGEIKVTLVRDKQSLVVTPTLGPATPQGACQFEPLDFCFEVHLPRIELFFGPM
ncbi:MAG: PDZ domain-containing protein [Chloracidobacterium sp.]|nr:PDZ domain-containing protein [Chloracidobacterium sp.]